MMEVEVYVKIKSRGALAHIIDAFTTIVEHDDASDLQILVKQVK